jgi:AAA15 family ATPase/GTPase
VQHSERLPRLRENKLLPVAAIYGGNGSGKSNFMFALKFARHLVVNGTNPDEAIPRRAFKLDDQCGRRASTFVFEILASDEKIYSYEFSVTNDSVSSEVLRELRPSSKKTIFRRHGVSNGQSWAFDHFDNRSHFSDEDRQFVQFIARGTRKNQLFLREAIDRNFEYLKPVYDWFASNLLILDPNSELESLETILRKRKDLRQFASDSLKNADTGIVELKGEEIPLEAASEIPPVVKEDIKRELKREGAGVLFRSSAGHRLSIYRDKGEVLVSRLYTHHRTPDGKEVRFEIEEESEGTRRLIDLLPVFYDLQNPDTGRVYIIDELDRSMHSYLTRKLLEGYLASCHESSRGQLIFTTHEEQLLDQSLLRRDEIWFLNKPDGGGSFLECLAEYEGVRNDTDIRKAYLHGRFSGVPHIRQLPRVNQPRELVEP